MNVNETKVRRRLEIRPSAELYAAGQEIARQLGVPLSSVATMAFASYVRNWAPPLARKGKRGQTDDSAPKTWDSGWPRSAECPLGERCGNPEPHDPLSHCDDSAPGSYKCWQVREALRVRGLLGEDIEAPSET